MSSVRVKYAFDAKDCGMAGPEPPHAAPAPPSRAARMLALAYHIERLVEAGELQSYAEAARVLGISRSRMAQVVALLNLPVAVQEKVLVGEVEVSERGLRELTWSQ